MLQKILVNNRDDYVKWTNENLQWPNVFIEDGFEPNQYPCVFVVDLDYLGCSQIINCNFIYINDFGSKDG